MKQDDLTQISHIGASRMKRFNEHGISTIQQLYEIPLEELAKIQTIGAFYAQKIKDGVAEYYAKNNIMPPAVESAAEDAEVSQQVPVTESPKEKPGKKASQKGSATDKVKPAPEEEFDLKKRVKKIQKRIKSINKKAQPLLEKKYQELYTDFENNFKQLKAFRKTIDQTCDTLSQKTINKMAKKADAVSAILKKASKKPSKTQYKAITKEVQSLAKALKKFVPNSK
ncbi:helix-hairpin-helix domain-containing protein [Desulfococcaceae bacterium HSG9]|nr:helix-hairpin-helix domain-containing protein [Desulfococcaceae bacterium HSG9]